MAIYYIDNVRGNNSNNGTSVDTAWKDLTQITTVTPAAGDKFLLEEGSTWYYPLSTRIVIASGSAGTEKNPVVISKYNYYGTLTTKKPTIQWYNLLQESDWTYDAPNNAWTYTAPFSIGNLCLVRLNNTWDASRVDTGLPLSSIDGRYFNSGTTFYLYAPSTTNPTKYYKEVLFSLADTGFFTISSGRGWITVDNLNFTKTGCGVLAYSGTAADVGVEIKNCTALTVGRIFYGTGDTVGQLRFNVHDNYISDWGSAAIQSFSVGGAGIKESRIWNNTIVDGGRTYSQGAIYIQTRNAALGNEIYNNTIKNVIHGSRDKIYDGCGIYCETVSSNVKVHHNLIENCYAAFIDNSGRTTDWYSNVILNCGYAMWCDDDIGNNATNHSFYHNTCITGKNIIPPFSIGSRHNGWKCVNDGAVGGTLNIYNNVFYNLGESQISEAAIQVPNITYTGNIYNNLCYNFAYVCRQTYSPFTVVSTNNPITTNPNFNNYIVPTLTSPATEAGILYKNITDFEGKAFNNPPTIGAYEYVPSRGIR